LRQAKFAQRRRGKNKVIDRRCTAGNSGGAESKVDRHDVTDVPASLTARRASASLMVIVLGTKNTQGLFSEESYSPKVKHPKEFSPRRVKELNVSIVLQASRQIR